MSEKDSKTNKSASSLTDRTAYIRGLADGMGINASKNENAIMLQMLEVMDEMAHKITELEDSVADVEEYIEDIDIDLADMEDAIFGDEDEDAEEFDDDEDEDEDDDELDEFESLSFDCPSCGKTVMIKASDIDFDESPICEFCGSPFFTDVEENDDTTDGGDEE